MGYTVTDPSRSSRSGRPTRGHFNQPECPLRFGEPCTLCQAYVSGPEDCQTVALVMSDPELRKLWTERRKKYLAQKRQARQAAQAKDISSK